jgi:hypothetical protein
MAMVVMDGPLLVTLEPSLRVASYPGAVQNDTPKPPGERGGKAAMLAVAGGPMRLPGRAEFIT